MFRCGRLNSKHILVFFFVAAPTAFAMQPKDLPATTCSDALDAGFVTDAAVTRSLRQTIENVADTPFPVLLLGETGTGKDLVAQTIHRLSGRQGPFISINCGSFSKDLLASQLFGHNKGAFTGATSEQQGFFRAANGGTIFLDEIAEMPPELQVFLLRILENNEVMPVGGTRGVPIDVRIIAATHQNLEQMVREKRFRQDLYYRLNIIPIKIPPLRERPEDVKGLIPHFLRQFEALLKRPGLQFTPDAIERLQQSPYPWPGNVRELKNFIARTLAMNPKRGVFTSSDIEEPTFSEEEKAVLAEIKLRISLLDDAAKREISSITSALDSLSSGQQISIYAINENLERLFISAAIKATGGNKTRAAELLRMPTRTFMEKFKEYGLENPKKPQAND